MSEGLKVYACKEYYSDWAKYLHTLLLDSYLERAQSFDKDTLYLQFAKKNFRQCLEIKFCDGYLLIFKSLKDLNSTNTQKGILQFKELENAQVTRIFPVPNDRQILFEFNNYNRLWFKGFGKFSNVLLQEFNTEKKLWHPTPSQIFRLGNKSDWEFQFVDIDLNSVHDLNSKSEQDIIDAVSKWEANSFQSFRNHILLIQKQDKLRRIDQKLNHLQKILKESQHRLENLSSKRSNKEIGDLILAHAHSLKPGISKALITDYFTQQRIWIKLNPELSAAENAKKYYGKAKNEIIEYQKLKANIASTESNKIKLEADRFKILNINDLKDLKSVKEEKVTKKTDTSPYKEIEFQGFTIWIGKNSKSNDELLRLSSKNDLWLHAKDFTGSHVIIRKRGIDYPKEIIEAAAKLAAQNSKAKTQSVIPVIYTLRKFVSKIKGGLPGQVNVQKELILDVYLR